MNYRLIPYFLKIAECKSLSAASGELGISVSTLSRYLSRTEDQVGQTLFMRKNQTLELTEAGKLYYEGVTKLQKLEKKTQYEIACLATTGKKDLKVGLTPSGAAFLTPFYPALMQQFPDLNLEIVEGYSFELLEGIRTGKIDMLLGYYNPNVLAGLRYATFFGNELFLMVPRYHPVAVYGSTELSRIPVIGEEELHRLEDVPFAYMSDQTIMGRLLHESLEALQFRPRREFRSRNSQFVTSLQKTGYYAGFSYFDPADEIKDVVYFRMPEPVIMYTMAVFHEKHVPGEAEQYICARHVEEYRMKPVYREEQNDTAKKILSGISWGR